MQSGELPSRVPHPYTTSITIFNGAHRESFRNLATLTTLYRISLLLMDCLVLDLVNRFQSNKQWGAR